MNLEALKTKWEKLTGENRADGYVRKCEELIAEMMGAPAPVCIPVLLSFLRDDAEYHELMFSIIHAVEAFGNEAYIRELLAATEMLWAQAPEWTSTLYLRLLNSKTAGAELVEQVRTERPLTKSLVKTVMAKISADGDQFALKAEPVILAAS